ncbi:MAG: alpha/beta fold hydrolase [Pseudomonadota bacterium]
MRTSDRSGNLALGYRCTVQAALGMVLLAWTCGVVAVETEVSIDVVGGTLEGSLLVPDLKPTVACGLIVAGSGPTDRNGNSAVLPGSNNSLKYLAQGLQAQGVETLRYDKRMVAASTTASQSESSLRFEHYVDDAVALYRWLDQRCSAPVFLLGHSEGGQIVLSAAEKVRPAGLVVLAGPGTHPADLIATQLSAQLTGNPLAQAIAALDTLRNGETVEAVPTGLESLLRPSVQPYLISWFAHDPAQQIEGLSLPILLLYGDTDLQVPVSEGELLASRASQARLQVIKGMNHVLKTADGGMAEQMASYSDPSLPLATGLMSAITEFMELTP